MYEKLLKITEECGANTFGGKTGMDKANGDMHTPPKREEDIEEEEIFKPADKGEPRIEVARLEGKRTALKEFLERMIDIFEQDATDIDSMPENLLDSYFEDKRYMMEYELPGEEAIEAFTELEKIGVRGTVDEDGTWMASPKIDISQTNIDLDPEEGDIRKENEHG